MLLYVSAAWTSEMKWWLLVDDTNISRSIGTTSQTWEGEHVGSTFRSSESASLFVESSAFVDVRDVIGYFSRKGGSTRFVSSKKNIFLKKKQCH